MQSESNTVDELVSSIIKHLETRVEIVKLKTIDRVSNTTTFIISKIIFGIVAATALLFLNIGLAIWISSFFTTLYIGFFVVAVFYLVVLLILFLGKDVLIKMPILNSIIKQFTK